MAEQEEKFLSRWSRLKKESRAEEQAEKAPLRDEKAEPAPTLPAVDKLTPESDFAPFMHPKVQDALRRVALKKLFSDPHFNIPDPFEAYSGDWTGGEPISEEILATLNQARTHLFGPEEKPEDKKDAEAVRDVAQAPDVPPEKKDDEPGRQDA